jgi:hypothetical protein
LRWSTSTGSEHLERYPKHQPASTRPRVFKLKFSQSTRINSLQQGKKMISFLV